MTGGLGGAGGCWAARVENTSVAAAARQAVRILERSGSMDRGIIEPPRHRASYRRGAGRRQIGQGPIRGSLPYTSSTGPSVTVVSVNVIVSVMSPPRT